MSTTDSIVAHHETWGDLPLFPQGQWVATDEDIEFFGDMVYLRAVADAVLGQPTGPVKIQAWPLVEYDIDLYLEPWIEYDPAAGMLAAWRMASGPGVAQLAIEAVSA